jgi:hypothetical protein
MKTLTLATPTLSRDAVAWRICAPGIVAIDVDVRNDHDVPTEADELHIAAAPLGAFIPPRAVARVAVGALEPGERRRVTARVPADELGLSDVDRFAELLAEGVWVGNLHLHFDREPDRIIEVHRAPHLRLGAGRIVIMSIVAGDGTERIRAEAACTHPDWEARVLIVGTMGLVSVHAPARPGSRARVEARMTRETDGKTVPVEFEFECVEGDPSHPDVLAV